MSVGKTNKGFQGDGNVKITKGGSVSGEDNDVDDEIVDLSCGIWKCRTNVFGKLFANVYVFSVVNGISRFFTMMDFMILPIQLIYVQRQFNLSSAQIGLFLTSQRIGFLSTALFAGHFCRGLHIPVIVGVSGLIQGVALMVPAFLQFVEPYKLEQIVAGPVNQSVNSRFLCSPLDAPHMNFSLPHMPEVSHFSTISASTAVTIIIVAQLIRGMAESFHAGTLPNVYLDDNVHDKSRMSFLIGVSTFISTLAFPTAMEINGHVTKIPVDLNYDNLMTPEDSRYVSAWWLPFLAFGICTFLSSVPLLLFPIKLISKKAQERAMGNAAVVFAGAQVKEERNGPKGGVGDDGDVKGLEMSRFTPRKDSGLEKVSHAHPSPKHLEVSMDPGSRRPSIAFQALEGPTERRVSLAGDIVYSQPAEPKVELHGWAYAKAMIKDMPSALKRIMKIPIYVLVLIDIIIISIPASGINLFKSTFLHQEYNVPMSEVASLKALSTAIASILGIIIGSIVSSRVTTRMGYIWIIGFTNLFGLLVSPLYIIFGCDNQPVGGLNNTYGSPINISGQCDCSGTPPQLSCGSDGLQYLSPCHAGCTTVDGNVFSNCSVVGPESMDLSLTPGPCPTGCYSYFLLYIIMSAFQELVERLSFVPKNLLILRLTDPRDRALATSTFYLCSQLVSVLSPNLFGSILDGMCIVKNENRCRLYDRDLIRYLICGTECGIAVIIMITQVIIMIFAKRDERKIMELQKKQEEEEQKSLRL